MEYLEDGRYPVDEFEYLKGLPQTDCMEYKASHSSNVLMYYQATQVVNGMPVGEGQPFKWQCAMDTREEAIEATRRYLQWAELIYDIVVRVLPEYYFYIDETTDRPVHFIRMRLVLVPKRGHII